MSGSSEECGHAIMMDYVSAFASPRGWAGCVYLPAHKLPFPLTMALRCPYGPGSSNHEESNQDIGNDLAQCHHATPFGFEQMQLLLHCSKTNRIRTAQQRKMLHLLKEAIRFASGTF
ncbi:hypothetical protein AAV99_02775 [Aurantiacibacter marinus]|uniref:Uncharacterized protein n=1 Tax=Aurantiacibacter marinus TaxID=874156 RepID=A0A0H0XW53_9SPHN|nr:hypothetical protein AAV99_02775 [Aurantiacibacter marinus]